MATTESVRRYRSKPETKAKHAEYMRAYHHRRKSDPAYQENLSASRARSRQKRLLATGRSSRRRFSQFGITEEIYRALWISQQGECAMCGKPDGLDKKSLAVDHDHATGLVRGLLCGPCNTWLGRSELGLAVIAPVYLERTAF